MINFLEISVKKIPAEIRAICKEKIVLACNIQEPGTPMEYLFDVYEEFVDETGENEDWTCWMCRDKVLKFFRDAKEYL